MTKDAAKLPSVTLVIEWENAIDNTDEWTDKAIVALHRELESVSGLMPAKPRIMYLCDETAVAPNVIDQALNRVAPRIRDLADVEIVPTPGLTYYKLKNFGIARSTTPLTVMLDSDAAPQPGWLENLLKPFADPDIVVVGGQTVLGYESLLDKTMALSWVFNLAHEREKTIRRQKVHVNNCAVRTDFFRAHPFPDLPAFKVQCVFWLRGLVAEGHKFIRTPDAMVIHAPHPGIKFLVWRAWVGGMDSDFKTFQTVSRSRLGRVGYAPRYFARKLWRSWRNIIRHGGTVGLRAWQRPPAMLIALAFYLITFVSQLVSALTRRFVPLPKRYTGLPETAA